MKINKFLLTATIALGLVSCKKEDTNTGVDQNGEKAWASFSVALPNESVFTRADAPNVGGGNAGDTYVGTKDEQKVSAVRIVLYDAGQVAYTYDLNVATDGQAAFAGSDVATAPAATKTRFVTKAKQVVKKDYQVLVLMNPTEAVKAVTNVSNNIAQFETAVSATVEGLASSANGFFMSNAQGLVTIPGASLQNSEALAESNAKRIAVDRAVAKVFVGGTPVAQNGDKVSGLAWTLDVTNKKTFWMRKLGNLASGSPEVAGDLQDALNRFNRYAVDPNMGPFAGRTAAALNAEFNYAPVLPVVNGVVDFADANGQYVLENTMNAVDQLEVATTRVLLKVIYTPSGYADAADWYSYKGFKMTAAEFKSKATEAETANADLVGLPAGFTADIKALKVAIPSYQTSATSFASNNVNFYKGGVSYYSILIRHFTDEQVAKENGYGRYGVVRNNIYKLTLRNISQPGSPVVVPPTDQPNDKAKAFVSFDTEVLPWLIRTQTVDL